MNTPATPAIPTDPVDAYLNEAKTTLCAALTALDINHVDAQAARTENGILITAVTAHKVGAEGPDLRATEPITSGRGEHHSAYDNLEAFAVDYLATVLKHRPDPFQSDGQVTFFPRWGGLTQPIDWTERWKHEAAEKQKTLQAAKAPIIKALASLGVAEVIISYDGEGDSGQVNDITATDAGGGAVALLMPFTADGEQPSTLHEALDELAWQCLSAYHHGFENNEGGEGCIVIDVAGDTITIDHNDRVIHLDSTTTEI